MRRRLAASVACSCLLICLAAQKIQPLNVKTGLWEITVVGTGTGQPTLPPELAARMTPEQKAKYDAALEKAAKEREKPRTYKSCVTKEKLSENLFDEDKANCKRVVQKSTGSLLELHQTCLEGKSKKEMDAHIEASDSENVKGTTHMTMSQDSNTWNLTANYHGKWVGPSCPADTKD